jgi:hypothetical protein
MRKFVLVFCLLFTLVHKNGNSQVIIASDDFENTLTLFTSSGPLSFFSGVSASGDRPAASPFSFSNNYAYGGLNDTLSLISNSIDVSTYSSTTISLKLAAFSLSDASNGLDLNDFVQISISPDNGVNYYSTLLIRGFSNSYWSYTGGTGIASAVYDGNTSPTSYSPSGGGERTTDGYSTITISGLPQVINLRVRITLLNNFGPELWLIDKFEVSGTPVTGPLINIFPFSLTGFSTVTGNPSSEKTYDIRGLNLTNNITINTPAGYEASLTSGSGFGSALTLTQSGGTVPWTTIYTRLNSTILGSNTGTIVNMSSGAANKNIGVSGNIFATEPTITSTVSFTNILGDKMTINFNGGNGTGRLVAMRLSTPITSVPTDGFNYSASNVFAGGAGVIGSDQYVVYNGTGNTVTVLGLNPTSTYHVAVFEYNDGGVIVARNYQSVPGTGNATTAFLNEGLEFTATNTLFTIDFDNTVARVNNGAFAGVDIANVPSAGQLNANAWSMNTSNFGGAAVFGVTSNTGGGVSPGNVTAGNFYAFETSPGNRAFGIQPTDFFWSGGNLTLRMQNNTGSTIDSFAVAYKLYTLNNTNGRYNINLGFSFDNIYYGAPIFDTTDQNADITPQWKSYLRSIMFRNLSLANGSYIYLRWSGATLVSGTGGNDEFAIDDIKLVANPTTVYPRIAGSFENMLIQGAIQLDGNTTIANNITLIGQNIELGNHDLIVGGNVNSISLGYLRTNGTGAVTLNNVTTSRLFPIGVTTYNPLTISNGSNLNWTARVSNGISNVLPPNNTERAVLRTWTISPSTNPPPSGANLTFGYNDGDLSQLGINFSNSEDVQVWHNAGSGWLAASNAITPTGTPGSSRTVTLNDWSQYSSFAIANLSGPLPVNFGLVKVVKTADGIKVKWTNYTEINISHYLVEHSADARMFMPAGRVYPGLNNGSIANYSLIDSLPYSGNNYYRIAAVETNGNIVYSMIVRINLDKSVPAILVVPNPIHGSQAHLQLSDIPKGLYEINIFTIGGQLISKNSLLHDGGSLVMSLRIPDLLNPGFYFIQVYNKDLRLQSKFILK